MAEKVYVLASGEYSDYHIVSIHKTRREALIAMGKYECGQDPVFVHQFDLDSGKMEASSAFYFDIDKKRIMPCRDRWAPVDG